MKHTTNNHFQPKGQAKIAINGGLIQIHDDSDCSVSVYAPTVAINDAIANYLPYCDRSNQERFMQVLTDHIRKIDNAEAQS